MEINRAGRVFLLLATMLPAMAFTALIPVLPAIEATFSTTPGATALTRALVSSLGLAMIVGSLAAGVLGARFGTRRALFAALVVFAAAGGAGGLAGGLWALLLSRVVLGLAASVIGILVVALVARSFAHAERDKWMGWIAAAQTIGSLACTSAAGIIGSIGWRYVCIMFLLALPVLALGAYGIRRDAPAAPGPAKAAPARVHLPRRAWQLAPLAIGLGAVVNATPMFLPFHLAEIGLGKPALIATAMLTAAAAGLLSSLAYGAVRRRLTLAQVFVLAFAVGSAGLALVGVGHALVIVLGALIVSGLGLGLAMPNLNAIAAAISTPAQTGPVIGLATGCFFAGGPLLQVCLDTTLGNAPARIALIIVAALSLALALCWVLLARLFRDEPTVPTSPLP